MDSLTIATLLHVKSTLDTLALQLNQRARKVRPSCWKTAVDLEVLAEGLEGESRVMLSHITMLIDPPKIGAAQ